MRCPRWAMGRVRARIAWAGVRDWESLAIDGMESPRVDEVVQLGEQVSPGMEKVNGIWGTEEVRWWGRAPAASLALV